MVVMIGPAKLETWSFADLFKMRTDKNKAFCISQGETSRKTLAVTS